MSVSVLPSMTTLNGQFASFSLSEPVTTPHGYARIPFDLPNERYVGLLACQCNPYLRELETFVRRCDRRNIDSAPVASRSNGKEKGKQKGKANDVQAEDVWEIELADTVLFPEGGGQATDTGIIINLDDSEIVVNVKEVIRRNLSAVHICAGPLPVGAKVKVRVDWARRHDLCTQHTAQHLLSAVFEQHFKTETLGWALSAYPNLSYVELPRKPTEAEIEECEAICNDLIVEGRKIYVDFAISQDDRPDTLPADYIGGVVRYVCIDKLDRNACCGTHYSSLSPLQAIHVSRHTTVVRSTNTRVYFLAGPRVAQQLSASLTQLRSAGQILSCANEDVSLRLQQLSDNYRDLTRREKRMREELAEVIAARIVQQARAEATDKASDLKGVLVREEDSTNDLEFLVAVMFKIKTALEGSTTPYTFALAHSGITTSGPDGSLIIFGSDEASINRIGAEIRQGKTLLTKRLKGGGKGRWQGKLTEGKFSEGRDMAELRALLEVGSDGS